MRIVEVHPNEVCTGGVRVEPRFCALLYLHTSALKVSPSGLSCRDLWEVIVVLETAIETGREILAVENHGAYECRSAVAPFLSNSTRVGYLGAKGTPKSLTPCELRQKPSHNARVRAISDGAWCES